MKKIMYAILIICSLIFILNSVLSDVTTYSNSTVFEVSNYLYTTLSFSEGTGTRVFLNYPLIFLIILVLYDVVNLVLKKKK